jgi:predicted dehydrogenase
MIRWLVIGIGDITRRRVIPAIMDSPRSRLEGLASRDPGKAAVYSPVKTFTTLEEALDSCEFDAVYVASPVFLHAAHSIASLRAGKHVLCEKPTAMNFAEAESIVQTAEEAGRLFGVAYYRRLFPKLSRAKRLIEDGVIGDPVFADANCHSWLDGKAPDWHRGWLLDPSKAGGGPLYDIASHRIDAVNFLFGQPSQAVSFVSNSVHTYAVEDSATVLIQYQHGRHAVVDVRWNSHVERDQFRIIGTNGAIDLDPLSGPDLHYLGNMESLPAHPNVHTPLIENFVSAILDGEPLACPGRDAILTDWVTTISIRQTENRVP